MPDSAIPYFYKSLFYDSEKDIQGYRKAMVGELFILFMLYFGNNIRIFMSNPAIFQSIISKFRVLI